MTRPALIHLAVAAAAMLAAPAALAAPAHVYVTSKAIADKPAVTPDPAMGYVLLRSERQVPVLLMKYPDDADRAAYAADSEKERASTFKRLNAAYARAVARHRTDMLIYNSKSAGVRRATEPPEMPVAPRIEDVAVTPIEQKMAVPIGPLDRFARGSGDGAPSVYLHAMTPGVYRLYGQVGMLGEWSGTCYCMGSVKFTVRKGEVTDLGLVRERSLVRQANASLDPRLSGWTIRPAAFSAVGKLANFYGVTVDRLAPMPGVISYDRDRIVDESAGTAAAGS